MRRKDRMTIRGFVIAAMVGMTIGLLIPNPLLAGPTGAKTISGSVSITQKGNTTIIHASNNSIIDFASFDIAAGQTVKIVEPSAKARVLEDVLGSSPTMIDGTLIANGHLYLVNPDGIDFSSGSVVNVGSLTAVAGQVSSADFLSGVDHFTQLSGSVSNEGQITAAGSVALIGKTVSNTGSVTAAQSAVLAAGPEVYVNDDGGDVYAKVTPAADSLAAATGGSGDVYALALGGASQIKANQIVANSAGSTTVSGTLDASSSSAGSTGGSVVVTGSTVALTSATVNASGAAVGGTINIGGGLHGQGNIQTASQTSISSDTTLQADATGSGNGGTIVVWSDELTNFAGDILARPAAGGQGGLAEVSSGNTLSFGGTADVGSSGTVLLDPLNITIVASGGSNDGNVAPGTPPPPNVTFAQNPTSTYTIDVDTLEGLTGNVVLQAQDNITLNIGAALAFTNQTSGSSVVFQAGNEINIQGALSTSGGNIQLEANSPSAPSPSGSGTIVIGSAGSVTSNNGNITMIGTGFAITGTANAGTGNILIGPAVAGTMTIGAGGTIAPTAIGKLTAASVEIGQATTAGSDGVGTGSQTITATAVNDTGIDVSGLNLSLTSSGSIFLETNPTNLGNTGTLSLNLTGASGTTVSQDSFGILTTGSLLLTGMGTFNMTNESNSIGTFAANVTGNVILDTSSDTIIGSVGSTNGVSIGAGNTLTLAANVTNGEFTDTSGGTNAPINAPLLLLTGTGVFDLSGTNITVGTLAADNSGNVTLNDSTALAIGTAGGVTGVSIGSGNTLQLTAAGITQNGSISAGTLQLGGTGTFDLTSTTNSVGTLTANTTGSVTLDDSENLTLDTVAVGGANTLSLNFVSGTGDNPLTISQSVTAGTFDLVVQGNENITSAFANISAPTAISIQAAAGDAGNMTFLSGASLSSASISLRAGDGGGGTSIVDFTSASAQSLNGAGGSSTSPTSLSIEQDGALTEPSASLYGAGTPPTHLTLTSDSKSVTIATAADVAGSNLALSADTTALLEPAALAPNSLSVTAPGGITLDGNVTTVTGQTYTGDLALTPASVTLTDGSEVNIIGPATGTSVALTLAAPIIGFGQLQGVTLTGSGDTTVDLHTGGSINTALTYVPSGGTLNIDPGMYSNVVTISIPITLANSAGNTGGAVTATSWTINSPINISGSFAASAAPGIVITSPITLDGNTTLGGPTLSVDGVSGPGNALTLSLFGSGGTVIQDASTSIDVESLVLTGSGTFTLANSGNSVSNLAAGTTGNVTLVDSSALTIDTVGGVSGANVGSGNTLTLNVTGGVTQAASSPITAGSLLLTGTGDADLNDTANSVGTLAADTTGNITLDDTESLIIGTIGTTSGVTVGGGDALTLAMQTSGTSVTQTALCPIDASSLVLSGSATFDLAETTNFVGSLAANTDGDLTLDDSSALTINGTGVNVGSGNSLTLDFTTGSGDDPLTITQSVVADTFNLVVQGNENIDSTFTANLSAPTAISIQAGASGTGNLTFSPLGDLSSDSITLRAGDGSGTTANINFTNAVLNGSSGSGTSPTTVSIEQDAALTAPDAGIYGGGVAPTNLDLTSDGAGITIAHAPSVAGANVSLSADTTVVLEPASLSAESLTVVAAPMGITLDGNVTTSTGQDYFGNVNLTPAAVTLTDGVEIDITGTTTGAPTTLTLNAPSIDIGATSMVTLMPGTSVGTVDVHAGGSIESGVDLTPTDGTLDIDPGTYDEDVSISRAITLVNTSGTTGGSVTADSWLITAPVTLSGSFTASDPVGPNGMVFTMPVTLSGNTVLNSTGGGNIEFDSTVDGTASGAESLAVNTTFTTFVTGNAGNILFGVGGSAEVGGIEPLSALSTSSSGGTVSGAPGQTIFDSTSSTTVQTTGDQTYSNPVLLSTPASFVALGIAESPTPGNITFGSTVDGNVSLNVNTSLTTGVSGNGGNITFGNGGDDEVGGNEQLTSITTTADPVGTGTAGKTTFDSSSPTTVNTSGNQTYNTPVILGMDTTLVTSSGNVLITGTVDGAVSKADSLVINSAGTLEIDGDIGETTTIDRLNLTSNGGVTTLGGSIGTAGAQVYNDPVTFTNTTPAVIGGSTITFDGPVLFTGVGHTPVFTSAGNLTFNSTVDGDAQLTVAGSGALIFMAAVGGSQPLDSLFAGSTAGVTVDSDITTLGGIQFDSSLVLNGNPQTISSGSTITFGDLQNADSLTVNGLVTFNASSLVFEGPVLGNGTIKTTAPFTVGPHFVRPAAFTGVFDSTINDDNGDFRNFALLPYELRNTDLATVFTEYEDVPTPVEALAPASISGQEVLDLAALGVYIKSDAQVAEDLEGQSSDEIVMEDTSGAFHPGPSDHLVTPRRLDERRVQAVIAQAKEVFGPDFPYRQSVTGLLLSEISAYRAKTGGQAVDAAGFAKFVAARPSASTFLGMRKLEHEIRGIGVMPAEAQRVNDWWTTRITPRDANLVGPTASYDPHWLQSVLSAI
jgi:fibronectin-binding autotransporter adhesin